MDAARRCAIRCLLARCQALSLPLSAKQGRSTMEGRRGAEATKIRTIVMMLTMAKMGTTTLEEAAMTCEGTMSHAAYKCVCRPGYKPPGTSHDWPWPMALAGE